MASAMAWADWGWRGVSNSYRDRVRKGCWLTYAESTGDAEYRLVQRRPDLLRKLDKVRFPLLC